MIRKTLITFCCCAISILLFAQTPSKGYTLKTVRRGEMPPPVPAENSDRHKFKVFTDTENIEFKLLFYNYVDGVQREEGDFVEIIRHGILSPNESYSIEIVPEISDDHRLFKLFFLEPSEIDIRRKLVMDSDKEMKCLFFSYESALTLDSYVPVLIAYEDHKTTNEVEKLLRPFIKDGLLMYDKQCEKVIKEQVKQYSMLFYTAEIY